MSEKKLLISFSLLFAIAAIFLFVQNAHQLNPQNDKNFWNLSFTAPENKESLEFTIENFTDNTNFDYTIMENNRTLEKNSVQVEKEQKMSVRPRVPFAGKATIVSVTHDQEKKEIYRK